LAHIGPRLIDERVPNIMTPTPLDSWIEGRKQEYFNNGKVTSGGF
jgi:hypothetical protein